MRKPSRLRRLLGKKKERRDALLCRDTSFSNDVSCPPGEVAVMTTSPIGVVRWQGLMGRDAPAADGLALRGRLDLLLRAVELGLRLGEQGLGEGPLAAQPVEEVAGLEGPDHLPGEVLQAVTGVHLRVSVPALPGHVTAYSRRDIGDPEGSKLL